MEKTIEELLKAKVMHFAKHAGLEESDVDWWVSWCKEMDLDSAFGRYVLPEFDEVRQAELTDLYELHFGRPPRFEQEPPKVRVYRPCCDRWIDSIDPITEVERLGEAFKFLKDELEIDDELYGVWMDELLNTDLWTAFERKVLPTFPVEERDRLREKARRKAGVL